MIKIELRLTNYLLGMIFPLVFLKNNLIEVSSSSITELLNSGNEPSQIALTTFPQDKNCITISAALPQNKM